MKHAVVAILLCLLSSIKMFGMHKAFKSKSLLVTGLNSRPYQSKTPHPSRATIIDTTKRALLNRYQIALPSNQIPIFVNETNEPTYVVNINRGEALVHVVSIQHKVCACALNPQHPRIKLLSEEAQEQNKQTYLFLSKLFGKEIKD